MNEKTIHCGSLRSWWDLEDSNLNLNMVSYHLYVAHCHYAKVPCGSPIWLREPVDYDLTLAYQALGHLVQIICFKNSSEWWYGPGSADPYLV